jgi:hypothetical protein
MVLQVDHERLKWLLLLYKKAHRSFLIHGTFGIGKSHTVIATGKEEAERLGREFAIWQDLTRDEKKKVFENCKDYFVVLDIRMSENSDGSDLKGIPYEVSELPVIEWKSTLWACLLEKQGSDGILFLDELNLATPMVINSCYKILQNRNINEGKIQDDWLIVGAGNLETDRGHSSDYTPAMLDRVGEVELMRGDEQGWLKGFAIKNNIHILITSFIAIKPAALYRVEFNDKQKFTTNRGWDRVNDLITAGELDVTNLDDLYYAVASAISEGIAKEFVSYVKLTKTINLEEIMKHPEKMKGVKEIDVQYFVASSFAERYGSGVIDFAKIIDLAEVTDKIQPEVVTMLFRMCAMYGKNFIEDFANSKITKEMYERYKKFIM